MNRWLHTGLFAIFVISSQSVWANCEREEAALARALDEAQQKPGEFHAKNQTKVSYERCRLASPKENEEYLRLSKRDLKAYQNTESSSDRLMVKRIEHNICILSDCLNSNSSMSTGKGSEKSSDPNNITGTPNTLVLQQSQSAQQQAAQAQQRAQQNQARADQERQGKRKTHDPAAEAHQCIDVDIDAPIVGGFKNKCSYAVSYGYCVFNPKKGGWTDSPIFNCNSMIGKTTAGGQDIKPNGYDVNHTRGGETVYFFACKKPAYAMDLTFIPGQGIQGRCMYF